MHQPGTSLGSLDAHSTCSGCGAGPPQPGPDNRGLLAEGQLLGSSHNRAEPVAGRRRGCINVPPHALGNSRRKLQAQPHMQDRGTCTAACQCLVKFQEGYPEV